MSTPLLPDALWNLVGMAETKLDLVLPEGGPYQQRHCTGKALARRNGEIHDSTRRCG
jgi:hypothetical protein